MVADIDLEELEAERGFFWTIVYLDVSLEYPALSQKWREYMYVGDLKFNNFWAIFGNFQTFVNLDVPEEKLEIFLAHQIWKYKCENKALRLVDRQIDIYFAGRRRIEWLSAELN